MEININNAETYSNISTYTFRNILIKSDLYMLEELCDKANGKLTVHERYSVSCENDFARIVLAVRQKSNYGKDVNDIEMLKDFTGVKEENIDLTEDKVKVSTLEDTGEEHLTAEEEKLIYLILNKTKSLVSDNVLKHCDGNTEIERILDYVKRQIN